MHLIQDENGNPVPHGHEHSHEHACGHEHDHDQTASGCSQECGGCGAHAHHGHSHEEPQGDKMTALLDYMVKHNEQHAAELDRVAEQFRAQGRTQVADQIKKATDEFQKGNLYLNLALSLVKEN